MLSSYLWILFTTYLFDFPFQHLNNIVVLIPGYQMYENAVAYSIHIIIQSNRRE